MSDTNTNSDNSERVYNLTKDLIQLQKNKKDTVAGFNEEIKRIKKEIEEILQDAEDKDV